MIHLLAVNWFYWWSVFVRPMSIGPLLQCLDGHFACLADFSCSHVLLHQLPILCGPSYSIDCKSRNQTICNAALHTLQRSEAFQDTCLCDRDEIELHSSSSSSPSVSSTCRSFYTFIYRHPCLTDNNNAPAASVVSSSFASGAAALVSPFAGSPTGEQQQQQQQPPQGLSPAPISVNAGLPLLSSSGAINNVAAIPIASSQQQHQTLLPGGADRLPQPPPPAAYATTLLADQYGYVDKFGLYYAHTGLLPTSNNQNYHNNNNNLIECTSAERACRKNKLCDRVQESFRYHCKLHNDFCRMTNPSLCYNSYELFKTTPLWQCRCDEGSSLRCRRIFLRSNRNPCIALAFPNEIAKSPTLPPTLMREPSDTALQTTSVDDAGFDSRQRVNNNLLATSRSNLTISRAAAARRKPPTKQHFNKQYPTTSIRPVTNSRIYNNGNNEQTDSGAFRNNNGNNNEFIRPATTATTMRPRYDTLPPLILPTISDTAVPPRQATSNAAETFLAPSFDSSQRPLFSATDEKSSSFPQQQATFFDQRLEQITIEPYIGADTTDKYAVVDTMQLAFNERRSHFGIQSTIGAGFPHTFALIAKVFAAEVTRKLKAELDKENEVAYVDTSKDTLTISTTQTLTSKADADSDMFFVGPGFPDDFVWFPSSSSPAPARVPSLTTLQSITRLTIPSSRPGQQRHHFTFDFSRTTTSKPALFFPAPTPFVMGNVSSTLSRPHETYLTFGIDDGNVIDEFDRRTSTTVRTPKTTSFFTPAESDRKSTTAMASDRLLTTTVKPRFGPEKSVRIDAEIPSKVVTPKTPAPTTPTTTTTTTLSPRTPFEICRDGLKRCREDEIDTGRYFSCSELLMSTNRACYVGDDQPVCQMLACRNTTETLNQTLDNGNVFRACLRDMDCTAEARQMSSSVLRECDKLKRTILQGCAAEAMRGDPPPSCTLTFVPSNNAASSNSQLINKKAARLSRSRPQILPLKYSPNNQLSDPSSQLKKRTTSASETIDDGQARLTVGQRSRIYNRNPLSRTHRYRHIESNLCECMQADQKASCRWLPDIQQLPCVGDDALFEPLDTAYIAFRGACVCFAGDFVCTRPNTTDYVGVDYDFNEQQGAFLFLGYSLVEEALLSTEINAKMTKDFLTSLQALQYPERFLSKCAFMHNVYDDIGNIILTAENFDVANATGRPSELTIRNQADCADYFYWIAYQVENGGETYASPLLSTIKIADALYREIAFNETDVASSLQFGSTLLGGSSLSMLSLFVTCIALFNHLMAFT